MTFFNWTDDSDDDNTGIPSLILKSDFGWGLSIDLFSSIESVDVLFFEWLLLYLSFFFFYLNSILGEYDD